MESKGASEAVEFREQSAVDLKSAGTDRLGAEVKLKSLGKS